MIISLIIWFVITLALGLPAYFWFDARRNGRGTRITGRVASISAVAAVIAFMITMGVLFKPDSSTKTANNSDTTSSQSSSTKSSSSSEEPTSDGETMDKLSSKKLSQYNSGIDDMLVEDKKEYSQGTKDYAWSVFVSKIQYNKGTGLTMYVNGDFSALNEAQRKVVGNRAQSLAKAQMAMLDIPITEDAEVMYLNVHDESNDRIGHSSVWDHAKFKWSDL